MDKDEFTVKCKETCKNYALEVLEFFDELRDKIGKELCTDASIEDGQAVTNILSVFTFDCCSMEIAKRLTFFPVEDREVILSSSRECISVMLQNCDAIMNGEAG